MEIEGTLVVGVDIVVGENLANLAVLADTVVGYNSSEIGKVGWLLILV